MQPDHDMTNFRRLPSSSTHSTASGSSSERHSRPRYSLTILRAEQRAKKMETIAQARAEMKQRLFDFCALKEQEPSVTPLLP